MEIVKKLMLHVDKAEGTTYRDELLTKIIDICSQSNYQYITNFEWSVLDTCLRVLTRKTSQPARNGQEKMSYCQGVCFFFTHASACEVTAIQ